MGQTAEQRPHFRHFSVSTPRALTLTATLKFPGPPATLATSALVNSVMFGSISTSAILGLRMQGEQSSVGKVLLSWAIRPPMLGFLSTRLTLKPASASWRAAVMPATPPPMTRTSLDTSTSTSFRGWRVRARLMPPLTRLIAFSVAPLSWTQLQCSLMLTWTS